MSTKICPSVPARCAAQARPGAGSPLMSAIFPAAFARASPTSTSSPSSASTDVENECVSPSMAPPSGRWTRPSSGKLMYASISRRSTSTPYDFNMRSM